MTVFRPALFLDRDGVVNREIGYLYRPDQVEFTPGVFDLCRHAQALGYALIIITNQSGIARQLYSETDFHSLMNWMTEEFLRQNVRVDGYYFCPHHPEYGVGPYRTECEDRKPQPGMILKASAEYNIDLKQSVLVGDRCSDIQAGSGGRHPEPDPGQGNGGFRMCRNTCPLSRHWVTRDNPTTHAPESSSVGFIDRLQL